MLVKHLQMRNINRILESELFKRKKKSANGYLVTFTMDLPKC